MNDISQPVLIICNLLKEDRKRFEIENKYDPIKLCCLLNVKDTKTGKQFDVFPNPHASSFVISEGTWMTFDESRLLGELVVNIYNQELESENQRKRDALRAEWLDLYKEDLQ